MSICCYSFELLFLLNSLGSLGSLYLLLLRVLLSSLAGSGVGGGGISPMDILRVSASDLVLSSMVESIMVTVVDTVARVSDDE